jgi:hypothetical protein
MKNFQKICESLPDFIVQAGVALKRRTGTRRPEKGLNGCRVIIVEMVKR